MYIAYALYSYMQHSYFSSKYNGDGEIRTLDPLLARQVLSQLSYTPILVVIFYLVQACPTSQWA